MVLDGPMNGDAFIACTQQLLAPELKFGDVVIVDNLPAHKVTGVRKAIEKAFSKLKALLRTVATRTIPELWMVIGQAIDEFKASECRNYFTACGYKPK